MKSRKGLVHLLIWITLTIVLLASLDIFIFNPRVFLGSKLIAKDGKQPKGLMHELMSRIKQIESLVSRVSSSSAPKELITADEHKDDVTRSLTEIPPKTDLPPQYESLNGLGPKDYDFPFPDTDKPLSAFSSLGEKFDYPLNFTSGMAMDKAGSVNNMYDNSMDDPNIDNVFAQSLETIKKTNQNINMLHDLMSKTQVLEDRQKQINQVYNNTISGSETSSSNDNAREKVQQPDTNNDDLGFKESLNNKINVDIYPDSKNPVNSVGLINVSNENADAIGIVNLTTKDRDDDEIPPSENKDMVVIVKKAPISKDPESKDQKPVETISTATESLVPVFETPLTVQASLPPRYPDSNSANEASVELESTGATERVIDTENPPAGPDHSKRFEISDNQDVASLGTLSTADNYQTIASDKPELLLDAGNPDEETDVQNSKPRGAKEMQNQPRNESFSVPRRPNMVKKLVQAKEKVGSKIMHPKKVVSKRSHRNQEASNTGEGKNRNADQKSTLNFKKEKTSGYMDYPINSSVF